MKLYQIIVIMKVSITSSLIPFKFCNVTFCVSLNIFYKKSKFFCIHLLFAETLLS